MPWWVLLIQQSSGKGHEEVFHKVGFPKGLIVSLPVRARVPVKQASALPGSECWASLVEFLESQTFHLESLTFVCTHWFAEMFVCVACCFVAESLIVACLDLHVCDALIYIHVLKFLAKGQK